MEGYDFSDRFNSEGLEHYPSYLDLLGKDLLEPDSSIEAIIVPQSRSAEHITTAAKLASASGSMLISLCSHDADAREVLVTINDMDRHEIPKTWYAVDVPPGYEIPGITLTSDQAIPEYAGKPEDHNLSDKRNIGLLLGRMLGMERIFFMDDDLRITPDALKDVGLMLFKRNIAGLGSGGFPDKSMIMHAKHAVVQFQYGSINRVGHNGRFNAGQISANSLGVNPQSVTDHFPRRIYNEDWLFIYGSIRNRLAGLCNNHYYQDGYDPFSIERARSEEFGDILIDGLYEDLKSQFDQPQQASNLPERFYWDKVIADRRRQYELLLDSLDKRRDPRNFSLYISKEQIDLALPAETQVKLGGALEAGLEINRKLDGSMFVDYIRAWRSDQKRWEGLVADLPHFDMLPTALNHLNLPHFYTHRHGFMTRPGIMSRGTIPSGTP